MRDLLLPRTNNDVSVARTMRQLSPNRYLKKSGDIPLGIIDDTGSREPMGSINTMNGPKNKTTQRTSVVKSKCLCVILAIRLSFYQFTRACTN